MPARLFVDSRIQRSGIDVRLQVRRDALAFQTPPTRRLPAKDWHAQPVAGTDPLVYSSENVARGLSESAIAC